MIEIKNVVGDYRDFFKGKVLLADVVRCSSYQEWSAVDFIGADLKAEDADDRMWRLNIIGESKDLNVFLDNEEKAIQLYEKLKLLLDAGTGSIDLKDYE